MIATAILTSVLITRAVMVNPGSLATAFSTINGGTARGFSLSDLDRSSSRIILARFRGQAVLLNFWASWCVPCRKEMPLVEEAFRRAGKRVVFIGIDTNDQRSAAQQFARHAGVTYPLAFDPKGSVALAYGLDGLPTTVLVCPQGRIVARHLGELTPGWLGAASAELRVLADQRGIIRDPVRLRQSVVISAGVTAYHPIGDRLLQTEAKESNE